MQIASMTDLATLSMNRTQDHEFAKLKQKAQDNKIQEVAEEFESLFIEMMFKEMKKTVNKTSLFGENNASREIFDGMLNTEYSKLISQTGGFGLADMIKNSLNFNQKI